jgi:hypothetical protein
MPRTPLQTRISIDRVLCHKQGDGAGGNAEPYLWTLFFKVDGDTVEVAGGRPRGTCTLIAADGTRGNLGNSNVDDGDDLAVPSQIGERRMQLRPIPNADLPGVDHSGYAGVVAILNEEDRNSPQAIRAGYAALVDFAKKGINELIETGPILDPAAIDASINALVAKAKGVVRAAIKSVDGSVQGNPDDNIGYKVFKVSHDELANNYWDINGRFQERTTEGVVVEDWQILGEAQGTLSSPHNYTHARRSQDVGAPRASGAPVMVQRPAHGVVSIVYRDGNKRLHELWRVGQVGHTDLTGAANAPSAEGPPFAYVETNTGVEIVLYRGADRHIHALSWANAIRVDDMSGTAGAPAALGDPVGIFNEVTGTNHIVYPGFPGPLRELFWAGAHDPVHDGGILTDTGTNPSLYFNSGGSNIIVFRGRANSHIYAMRWNPRDPSDRGEEELSNVAGTPPAAGDPVACYVAAADLNQVVHRAGDRHLYEISWRGVDAVVGRDLMAQSGAPEAYSDPAVFYSALTNTTHVVYCGPSGHLFEIWWPLGGMPAFVDLTLSALAPRAVDRPVGLSMDVGNTRFVVYRGTDGHIHEISWIARP